MPVVPYSESILKSNDTKVWGGGGCKAVDIYNRSIVNKCIFGQYFKHCREVSLLTVNHRIVSVNVEMQHSMIPDNEKTHFTAHCVFNFALPVQ